MKYAFFVEKGNLLIYTVVSPRPNFRVRVLKFKMKVGLLNLYGPKKISALRIQKLADIEGRKNLPTPSFKSQTYDFRNFLPMASKENWLKTLKM